MAAQVPGGCRGRGGAVAERRGRRRGERRAAARAGAQAACVLAGCGCGLAGAGRRSRPGACRARTAGRAAGGLGPAWLCLQSLGVGLHYFLVQHFVYGWACAVLAICVGQHASMCACQGLCPFVGQHAFKQGHVRLPWVRGYHMHGPVAHQCVVQCEGGEAVCRSASRHQLLPERAKWLVLLQKHEHSSPANPDKSICCMCRIPPHLCLRTEHYP